MEKYDIIKASDIKGMSSTIDALCSQMLPDVWTFVSPPKTSDGTCEYLTTAMYGNGVYIIAGNDCFPLKSNDGIHWEEVSIPNSRPSNYTSSLYTNGLYILSMEGGGIYYSSDSISWQTSIAINEPKGFTSLAYGNGIYVGIGKSMSNIIHYSTDLRNWSYSTLSGASGIAKIVFGNNEFCAVTNNGKIFFSSNGITWAEGETTMLTSGKEIKYLTYSPIGYGSIFGYIYGYGDEMFYRRSADSEETILAKTSADTTVNPDYSIIKLKTFSDVAYGNGKLVIAGTDPTGFGGVERDFFYLPMSGSFRNWMNSSRKFITTDCPSLGNINYFFFNPSSSLSYVGNRFMAVGGIRNGVWALAYSFS